MLILRSRRLGLYHFGHPHEVGQGPCAHFAHGRTPVKFYRDLAYSKIAGYLLVHFPGCHQHHHLLFPCGQCFEPLPHLRRIAIEEMPVMRSTLPDSTAISPMIRSITL